MKKIIPLFIMALMLAGCGGKIDGGGNDTIKFFSEASEPEYNAEIRPTSLELSADGYNVSLSDSHIKVEYKGVVYERDLDSIYAQMAYNSIKDFDDLTDKESTLNILYLMSKNAGYGEIFESITR